MKTIIQSIAALVLLSSSAFAGDLVNVSGASNAALSGFDPVAFFTDAKPVNGSPFISAEHQGATYFFDSEEHKSYSRRIPQSTRRSLADFAPSEWRSTSSFPWTSAPGR